VINRIEMSVDSKVSKYSNKNKNLLYESANTRRKLIKNETFRNYSDHVCERIRITRNLHLYRFSDALKIF
jgi:predicted nucleotide-binding protein (sugar kinase/HSP70/actin superfamily)